MTALDVLILLSLASAVIGGYRLGFMARITSWAGLALGIALGARFLPEVASYFTGSEPEIRLLAAAAFLLAAGMLGQGLGLAIGAALHASLRVGPGLRQYDRVAGGFLGAVGILLIFWLLAPSLASVPGWTSRAARDSRLLAAINKVAPDPPDTLAALRRLIGGDLFPEVFEGRRSPAVGPAPPSPLGAAVDSRVRASTVKVVGEACRRIQEGSGFTVVGPDLVVTNAHVVAGEDDTEVETESGRTLDATVVFFDHRRDLAVLRVPGLNQDPLPIGSADSGAVGAVYGHPGGGPLRPAGARIEDHVRARGRDIYDRERTERDVFVLAADLAPGDSGGALVDESGTVVGVAFAIAPDRDGTAYALTDEELRPVVAAAGSTEVDTGACLVG